MMKIDYKSEKNNNNICCCHDDDGAVFRVQGPYLIIEQTWKIMKNSLKMRKNKKWYLLFL